MAAIPRYRAAGRPTLLSAGSGHSSCCPRCGPRSPSRYGSPVYVGRADLPSALPPTVWHVHEMIFGFAAATVAGFLLTAIPNWTGRMPLQGGPLATLVLLWLAGRIGVLVLGRYRRRAAACLDLAFPARLPPVVVRGDSRRTELAEPADGGGIRRPAPDSNFLVHPESPSDEAAATRHPLGIADAAHADRLVGGRIIPSFTRNWLARERPEARCRRPSCSTAPCWR